MTTLDAAMSMYLNGNQNVKGRPNENYARELMELFCLGPKAPDGTDNYSQADVEGLAQALTGWRLNSDQPSPDYGKSPSARRTSSPAPRPSSATSSRRSAARRWRPTGPRASTRRSTPCSGIRATRST